MTELDLPGVAHYPKGSDQQIKLARSFNVHSKGATVSHNPYEERTVSTFFDTYEEKMAEVFRDFPFLPQDSKKYLQASSHSPWNCIRKLYIPGTTSSGIRYEITIFQATEGSLILAEGDLLLTMRHKRKHPHNRYRTSVFQKCAERKGLKGIITLTGAEMSVEPVRHLPGSRFHPEETEELDRLYARVSNLSFAIESFDPGIAISIEGLERLDKERDQGNISQRRVMNRDYNLLLEEFIKRVIE